MSERRGPDARGSFRRNEPNVTQTRRVLHRCIIDASLAAGAGRNNALSDSELHGPEMALDLPGPAGAEGMNPSRDETPLLP